MIARAGNKIVRDPLLPSRVGATMLACGAVLLLVGVMLPPPAEHSDAVIVLLAAIAFAAAVVLWWTRTTSELALGGVPLLGTAIITATLYQAGTSGSGDDAQIAYLWVCLYAFYFLRVRHALAQLAFVGACYAAVLTTTAPPGAALPNWVTTTGTLLVAGLVIASLRSSLERSVEELARQARLDSLTGALNRHALAERAAVEFARSRREATPIAVIQIDVDRFKQLNDSLGHPVGDDVLRCIADALADGTRPTDAVARVGGDEFAVLLPSTSADDAAAIADRLRTAVARNLDLAGTPAAFSVGVAGIDGPPRLGFDELWAAADAAMYDAKRAGGDGVRSAPPLAAGA